MRRMTELAALLALSLLAPDPVQGQQQPRAAQQGQQGECVSDQRTRTRGAPPEDLREYDVIVEVPDLCVDRLRLVVRRLDAHVSLNARVANLVRVQAGADVGINAVDLTIQGVRAQALLLVDLDNVTGVVDRILTFVDDNPQIISQLYSTAQGAVGTVGGLANTALQPGGVVGQTVGAVGQTLNNVTAPGGVLSQTVNTLGQTVQRTVNATGGIVERTLDTTGRVVGENAVGNVLDLPLVRETKNAAGQTLRQVRDQSGSIIELTLDQAGNLLGSRVVQQGRQQ